MASIADDGFSDETEDVFGFRDVEEINQSYIPNQRWLECITCQCILDYPLQLHWCSTGLSPQLRHMVYFPECSKCFCVLECPFDPHRCPEESQDVFASDADWLECRLCFTILDYATQPHECPEEDEGFGDDADNIF